MAGDDRGGIGIRIDAQEARASVEGVRKVACPLFLSTNSLSRPDLTVNLRRGKSTANPEAYPSLGKGSASSLRFGGGESQKGPGPPRDGAHFFIFLKCMNARRDPFLGADLAIGRRDRSETLHIACGELGRMAWRLLGSGLQDMTHILSFRISQYSGLTPDLLTPYTDKQFGKQVEKFNHWPLAHFFASLLQYVSLRGPYAPLDSPLPSLPHAVLRHLQRGFIPMARHLSHIRRL